MPITFTPSERGRYWPSGRETEIAYVDIPGEDIVRRLGRPFLEGFEEGLGPWRADGFVLSTGELMELIFYDYFVEQCFILRVDSAEPPDLALAHFLEAFGLTEACVRWRIDASLAMVTGPDAAP